MAIKHKKAIIGILLCLTLIFSVSLSGCTSPAVVTPGNGTIKIVDSSGKTITFDKPAERIIVMGSDQAEILIAIGAGDKIVGVVNSVKNNPTLAPLVKNVTDVGAWDSPNIETILSQRPDVVVAYASYKPKNLADFEKANITILMLDCNNLKALVPSINALGQLTGQEAKAAEFASFIQGNLDLVSGKVGNLTDDQKPLTYWEQNTDYKTAGNGTGGDTLIKLAGGTNMAGNMSSGGSYLDVSADWVLTQDPQFIIKTVTLGTTLNNMTAKKNAMVNRTGMSNVRAVKDDKIVVISSSFAFGPKGSIGLVYLAKAMHPELFADADVNALINEYATKYVPGADKETYCYPAP